MFYLYFILPIDLIFHTLMKFRLYCYNNNVQNNKAFVPFWEKAQTLNVQ